MKTKRTNFYLPAAHAQNEFPGLKILSVFHTLLSVPLRQQGELIGTLSAHRIEVRPFTPGEKECAAVRQFKAAYPLRHRSSKGALLMAE